MNRGLLATAAFIAGLALLYSLLVGPDKDGVESDTAGDRRGYYAKDATLTETGLDGKPRVVVHAVSVEEQVPDRSIRLADVWLDYTTARSGQWHVTAERGRMTPDHTSMQLSGNVRVAGTQGRSAAVITTDELAYDTRANLVQTAEPVVVRFGQHELNGRGMRANLDTGTLQLESNVNGRFTP
jgi:LPS export ABC transporter protein LptC